MADLNTLYSEKNQYLNLKTQVSNLANSLKISGDTLPLASSAIAKSYLIDELSADNGAIDTLYNDLIERSNFLNSTVISAIDGEITRIDQEIEAEKRRIEEEERRKEKEERLRRLEEERNTWA